MMELDVMVEEEDPAAEEEGVAVEELCAGAEEDAGMVLLEPGSNEEPPTELPAADELCPGTLVDACATDEDCCAVLDPVEFAPLLPAPEETLAAEEEPGTPLEEDEDDGDADDDPTTPEELLPPAPTATQVPSVVHTKPPRQSAESRHSFLLSVHANRVMPRIPPSQMFTPRMTAALSPESRDHVLPAVCFAAGLDLGWKHTTP